MKVLLLTRYSKRGASSRLRFFQYIPYLEECGCEIKVSALLDDTYLESIYNRRKTPLIYILKSFLHRFFILLNLREYDLIFIEKEIFPWLPSWAECLLSCLKVPYIVDYDDAIFHNYDLHESRIVRILLKQKISNVMRYSQMVIAGNKYIEEYANNCGAKRVQLLPTVVDLKKYSIKRNQSTHIFTIGWIGSPSTTKFLKIIEPALKQFCTEEKAHVLLVGAEDLQLQFPMEIRQWSEETEVSDIQSFDVGIMPLLNEPWEKGKCGYKLIQYMACGIPVISSPVGINKEIVDHGVNGFLANNHNEWLSAFRELFHHPEMRYSFGNAGRKKVEISYSIQKAAPLVCKLMKEFMVNK